MITLQRYKDLRGITTTANDAQINALLSVVTDDYLAIRGRPFDTGRTLTVDDAAGADGDITVAYDGTEYEIELEAGDTQTVIARKISHNIPDASVRGAVVTVISDVPFALTYSAGGTGSSATVSNYGEIYPVGSEMTAADMIGWQMQGVLPGVMSESLGGHSVSYSVHGKGSKYPHEITRSIKRFLSWV